MGQIGIADHVEDFLERGVHQEHAAQDHDQGVTRQIHFQELVHHGIERIAEQLDQLQDHDQKHDAEHDRQRQADAAHALLVGWAGLLGLQRDVEQVVEAQHRFQRGQDQQRRQRLDGEQAGESGRQGLEHEAPR